uniref:Peptidase S26 domain-containing protein n=1 Tax=Anaerolinea thermolimosa TaxID=229919 RepID=A0A7C4KK60_9CHLR
MILKIMRVQGSSLAPDFANGDYVVVSALPLLFRRLRPGRLIVFHQPGYGQMIKRVAQVEPCGKLFVLGSGEGSVDSRTFGPIERRQVEGVVVWGIHRRRN